MTLNRVKQGSAVTFMKQIPLKCSLFSISSENFDLKKKITFPPSNFLNPAELVVKEHMKSKYKKIYRYSFSILSITA